MVRGVAMLFTALFLASRALAAGPGVDGEYDSPLGRVQIRGDGTTYRGVLVEPSPACTFRPGEEVLRATLLDDSLAGQVRVFLKGSGCRTAEVWASAVLLVQEAKLSGALHVAAKGCTAPLGKRGGIVFARAGVGGAGPSTPTTTTTPTTTSTTTRLRTKAARGTRKAPAPSPSAATAAGPARERARTMMRDGAAHLQEGNFEAARKRFLEAIDVDATIPEAYNGVGVTYRMRNELDRALDWYKKALAVDPDFGDAYYNMACVYALRGEKEMALRYLQIAAMNGYATAEGIGQDPDLEPLRAEPGYRALVRAKM